MQALILLGSTFSLVFLMGLQSLVVTHDHKFMAFINSFLIGAAQLALYRLAPQASGWETAAYLIGGPFGVVAAMYAFQAWKSRKMPVKPTL